MMFRAVARIAVPLVFAAGMGFSISGQSASPATSSAQAPRQSPVQEETLGASTSLNSSSNDLASLYGTPVEQIVARVNDRVITNSDIARAQTQLQAESRQNNWTLEQYNHNEKNLLRDLIDQQLLLSKGKQLGITGDTELIKRLDDIRKQNHLDSIDDLEKAVEQQGTSWEDFQANIRNSIVTQEVVRNEVGSKIQISQAEIRKYYEDHTAKFTQPESVHLKEILITTPENASASQLATADATAKDLEQKLKNGGNFSDLAKKYSGGPTAQQGGDLGDFRRGTLAKVLEDKTFDLPPGGYTAPIRTRQGYVILQVTAHNPGGTQPMQKVEPDIEQAIYLQKIEPAVREYLTRLRDEAYIDIRPGFTDSAASPNESKPTYAAYVPPQPKKKKKKARFHQTGMRYSRLSQRKKAATETAAVAPAPTSAGAASTTPEKEHHGLLHFRKAHQKKQVARKNKPEKFRFGRAPAESVSDEQVATATGGSGQTAPAVQTAPTATDVQPLGPDLEHNPKISQPKEGKRRFSDEARNKHEMEVRNKRKGIKKPKKKKVKVDNARPTALTPTEAANEKVQSAPLGLNGATATKKKKQKIKIRNGHKTRLEDQKKKKHKNSQSSGSDEDTNPPASPGGDRATSPANPS